MSNSRECPSVEQLQQLALGQLPDPPASSVEQHLFDCEPCTQATLNFVTDETLVGAMRKATAGIVPLPDGVSQLILKLRDLPTHTSDADSATVLSGEAGSETMLDIDWSSSFTPAEAADEIGRLNGFRILKLLGQGGMGGVFLAEDMHLQRRVALKVMRPEFAARRGATERFLREARAVAAIHDEHIVTIYQVGQDNGVPFLAQELLEGETLDARLKRENALPIADVIEIGQQIAKGLAAAHAKGLIHRDIKPANVWLESSPVAERQGYVRVKLLDFGLARSVSDSENLTQSGMILGTPAYMAPEQARGDAVDARADLFSLGCVLFQCVTGQRPFPGKGPMAILHSLATHTPAPVTTVRADVPAELSDLIERLLAKDREARPASAQDVARELARERSRVAPRLGFEANDVEAVHGRVANRAAGNASHGMTRLLWGGLAACVLFGVIVIKLKDKDGKETKVTLDVPDGTKLVSVEQQSGKEDDPAAQRVIPQRDFITLDKLDPKQIPESERFDWQPDELVAVIGDHRLRDWSLITSVAFHPSGDFFVSTPGQGNSHVWSAKTFERLTGYGDPDFPEGVNYSGLSFAPDGKSFCTGYGKFGVDLSDAKHPKFRRLGKRPVHKIEAFEQLVISPDGRWLVMAGGPAGILEVWDITGDVPQFVKEVSYPTRSRTHFLDLSSDGHRLSLYADGTAEAPQAGVLLWDIDWDALNGPSLKRFSESIPGYFAALSPDGQTLVASPFSGSQKSQVFDLSVSPPKVVAELEGIHWTQFSPDGDWLAHCIGGDFIMLRQRVGSKWEERSTISAASSQNARFWFAPDGKTLVVSEFGLGWLRVWDLTTNPPAERALSSPYSMVAFSPDGRMLATSGPKDSCVWKMVGESPQKLEGMTTQPMNSDFGARPTFSPDSQLIAFAFGQQSEVWNLSDPTPKKFASDPPRFVRFAPQGQSVLIYGWDFKLASQPWEITKRGAFRLGATATELAKTKNHASPQLAVDRLSSLRPELKRYVDVQDEGKLQVFELTGDRKPLFEVQHPQKMVFDFTLSADGNILAAFPHVQGGVGMVWDLTETPPREYPLTTSAGGFESFFTPDGKLLVVATGHGIEIHDWAAGRLVRQIPFPGPVTSITLHPDGHHLATVNGNGTVYILRLPELAEHSQSVK